MTDQPLNLRPSSNIASASYDPETQELTVEFVSGGEYVYSSVPSSVASGLAADSSPGGYFARQIKGRYSYTGG